MKKSDFYLIIANMWIVCEWPSTGPAVWWAFGIAVIHILLSTWFRLRNE